MNAATVMETRTLNAALHQISLHDTANRDYATMTDACEAAVQALADELGQEFDETWVEIVQESRATRPDTSKLPA